MNVLLLGEGDFSFAAALARLPPTESAAVVGLPENSMSEISLTASSLDSEAEVLATYPEARLNLMVAGERCRILHGVDALRVEGVWDAVVWNHPHLGVEDAQAHKCLLTHFLNGCPAPLVVIRLLAGQAERWGLAGIQGWYVSGGFKFPGLPGYRLKRNLSAKSFVSEETRKNWIPDLEMGSLTYILTREKVEVKNLEISPPERVSFSCGECGKESSTEQGLRTHRRQIHELKKYSERQNSVCQICSREFNSCEALSQHEKVCSGPRSKRVRTLALSGNWVCGICGARAENEDDHLRIFYQQTPRIPCQNCGREFRDERAIFQHCQSGGCQPP